MWYRFFKYALFRPGVRLLMHPELVDERNIPATGPAVLASNHLDAGDTFTLPALMRRRLIWPAKKELFEGKGLRMRIVARFLRAVGMVPLDRSGGRASVDAMGPVEAELAAGNLIGIFPEGTRTPVGLVPRIEELNLDGFKGDRADLERVLRIDTERWRQEMRLREEHLSQFEDLPEEIWEAHRRVSAALEESARNSEG